MIDQKDGSTRLKLKFKSKEGIDKARIREQDFWYTGIPSTPFSLGISIPVNYGNKRLSSRIGFYGEKDFGSNQLDAIFPDDELQWSLNPNWVYCKYTDGTRGSVPKDKIKHILEEVLIKKGSFDWDGTSHPFIKCK